MEASRAGVVVEGRAELVGPMDPAAIHNHHDVFAGFAEGGHDLMAILAQLLGIKVGHDFIENFRSPILDRADDAQEDAAGDATPRAILQPRLAFEGLLACDLALAGGGGGGARAVFCATSPRGAGQSARGRFHLHRSK